MWKQHILVRRSPPKQWTKGNRVALQSIGCPVRIRYVGFQISSFFCGYTYMQCMLVGKLVCCSMLMMSAYVMFAIVVGLQRRGEHETFPSLIFIYLFASGAMQFILLYFFFFFIWICEEIRMILKIILCFATMHDTGRPPRDTSRRMTCYSVVLHLYYIANATNKCNIHIQSCSQ